MSVFGSSIVRSYLLSSHPEKVLSGEAQKALAECELRFGDEEAVESTEEDSSIEP